MPNRLSRLMSSGKPHLLAMCLLVCVVAAAGACSDSNDTDKGAKGGAGGEGEGGTASDVGGSSGTSRGGSGVGGSSLGGTGSGGSSSGGSGSGGAAGQAATGGAPAAPVAGPWEFNDQASISIWELTPDSAAGSTLAWVAQGEAEPLGSIVASSPDVANVTLILSSPINKATEKLYFRVRTDGESTTIKPFVFSAGWIWADGGEQPVTSTWSTANIDIASPAYEPNGYDGTRLIHVGFQVRASTIWVDRIWFE